MLICGWGNRAGGPEIGACPRPGRSGRRPRLHGARCAGGEIPRRRAPGQRRLHNKLAAAGQRPALPSTPLPCFGPGAAAHVLPHLTATERACRPRRGRREPKASGVLGEGPYSTDTPARRRRPLATEPCLSLQRMAWRPSSVSRPRRVASATRGPVSPQSEAAVHALQKRTPGPALSLIGSAGTPARVRAGPQPGLPFPAPARDCARLRPRQPESPRAPSPRAPRGTAAPRRLPRRWPRAANSALSGASQ